MAQKPPVLRCTGTPAVHSSALLGGVPNLQVNYTTGLKPLASILNMRATGKAQTQIRNTKQESSKSGLLSLYYYLVSRIPF